MSIDVMPINDQWFDPSSFRVTYTAQVNTSVADNPYQAVCNLTLQFWDATRYRGLLTNMSWNITGYPVVPGSVYTYAYTTMIPAAWIDNSTDRLAEFFGTYQVKSMPPSGKYPAAMATNSFYVDDPIEGYTSRVKASTAVASIFEQKPATVWANVEYDPTHLRSRQHTNAAYAKKDTTMTWYYPTPPALLKPPYATIMAQEPGWPSGQYWAFSSSEVDSSWPLGTYMVIVDATANTGYIVREVVYFVITPILAPIASFTANPTSGTEPLVVAFTDQSTSQQGIVSWLWTFGDGSTSNERDPSHGYKQQGIYTVSLTVREADDDSDAETKTGYVAVADTDPTANFSATPGSGSEPLMVGFVDESSSYDGIISRSWSFGDGHTTSDGNPTHTYVQEGVYTVGLTVTEGDGDGDTETRKGCVVVTDQDPTADFLGVPRSGPEPLAVSFTGISTSYDGIVSWSWSFGDGSSCEGNDPAHSYARDGNYTVSVTVWEADGDSCTTTKPAYITVTPGPKPAASFLASPRGGQEPLTVIFADQSTSVEGLVSWSWSFGDGWTSAERNPAHTYLRDGTYTVSLTVAELDGDTSTETKASYITVTDNKPDAEFSVSAGNGTEPLGIGFADLSTSYDGVVSWSWSFGDGWTSTGRNATHVYPQEGMYTVSLTVWEVDGDSDTEVKTDCIAVMDSAPVAEFSAYPRNASEPPLGVAFLERCTSYDGAVGWLWSFGDGGNSTQRSPFHVFSAFGSYDVSLRVWERDGDSDLLMKRGYVVIVECIWVQWLVGSVFWICTTKSVCEWRSFSWRESAGTPLALGNEHGPSAHRRTMET